MIEESKKRLGIKEEKKDEQGCAMGCFSLILSIVLSIILVFLYSLYDNIRTSGKEVNGMVWGTGKDTLTAHVRELAPRENQLLLLTIYDAENRTVFKKELLINWDMWGAGFLSAMQFDDDPEPEIVFCVNHSQQGEIDSDNFCKSTDPINYNFYVDINSGKIEVKGFSKASSEGLELAKIKLSTAENSFTLILFLFFITPFNAFLIHYLLMRFFKKILNMPIKFKLFRRNL